ncbi:unnamed protein product [Rhizophagus irregularis]|nr:unnamed protein product [Rhizophagus irregularis]
MIQKFLKELSDDYENLFETEIGYDVIIYAGDESNVKEIHAHSNILCTRSKYFRTAFSNGWAIKKDGKFIFRKSNIQPHLFDIILRFIYSGNIELKNLHDGNDISTAKLGYVKKPDEAIYCYYNQGPHMGYFYCKHNNEWTNNDRNATCYPNIGIPSLNFRVENYEVFQIIKK